MNVLVLVVLVVFLLIAGLGWWDSRKLRDGRRWS